jgi:hypothetical protein
MKQRLDGKRIQPRDLTPEVYEGTSIVENIVLATSNHLRSYLGLSENETISGPIPKFVTRKNPSLDNYFAELLLRACYEPVDYLPGYEEHVIRGSEKELPSALNPRLVDSVLIGIGGISKNPDFKKKYDEHDEHGRRKAKSATRVVFNEHLRPYNDRPSIASLEPILFEIDIIDSSGHASYDHIFSFTKSLNIAQFRQPGFVAETLEAQWKRAIIGAMLMSVCVSVNAFGDYDNQKAIDELGKEWELYQLKSRRMIEGGFLDPVADEVVSYVKNSISKPGEFELHGGGESYLTLRKILFALQKVWHQQIISFLMGFIFEAMLQAQQSFEEMKSRPVPVRDLNNRYAFLYYQKQSRDKLPHRGLLFRMNNERKRALLVFNDPVRQITSVFRNNYLPPPVWERFVKLLTEKESNEVWYIPTQEDGQIAAFILNGTESFIGVPMTELAEEDFFQLFSDAIKSASHAR